MKYRSYSISAANAAELSEKINAFFDANPEITLVSTSQSQNNECIVYTILFKEAPAKREISGFKTNH
ncbi:hypothetical protein MKQ68_13280 [Chitinophaga horti]|uniref:Uncharacterized protein n=1 Tax=Chitinophaga horti TaxID=2920382 RepID=A0ABY6IUM8_9BACT|nr:hypothetical protein [Chitinophaga horti]UYQ91065.1 hypothetical protein MKQ68_13280 [Chitinophaga horti]